MRNKEGSLFFLSFLTFPFKRRGSKRLNARIRQRLVLRAGLGSWRCKADNYEQALAATRRGVTAARAPVRIQLTGIEVSVGATNAQPISFPVMIRGIKKLGS